MDTKAYADHINRISQTSNIGEIESTESGQPAGNTESCMEVETVVEVPEQFRDEIPEQPSVQSTAQVTVSEKNVAGAMAAKAQTTSEQDVSQADLEVALFGHAINRQEHSERRRNTVYVAYPTKAFKITKIDVDNDELTTLDNWTKSKKVPMMDWK